MEVPCPKKDKARSRIKSMSLIHEMLYNKEDFAKINCREYINKLVKDLVSAINQKANEISITIKIDDIMLGVDTAIPLGLITNELVTNALNNAFPHGWRRRVNCQPDKSCRPVPVCRPG